MSSGSFTIGMTSQDVSVDLNNVIGRFDGLRSSLRVFVNITLRLSEANAKLSFVSLDANLLFAEKDIHLSHCCVPFGQTASSEKNTTGAWFEFILDDAAIFCIQKISDGGDVPLKIAFNATALTKDYQSIVGQVVWSLGKSDILPGDVRFMIPRSMWVEKTLPGLGYPGFKLIEIPITHKLIKEAYDHIITEFDQAQDYYNKADYSKCVGHCRHALDTLHKNLINLKNGIESKTAFKWLSDIDEATFTWIDQVDKSLTAIASKPHHIGLDKEFTRVEAESIYLVTLGLLNFVGQAAVDYQK